MSRAILWPWPHEPPGTLPFEVVSARPGDPAGGAALVRALAGRTTAEMLLLPPSPTAVMDSCRLPAGAGLIAGVVSGGGRGVPLQIHRAAWDELAPWLGEGSELALLALSREAWRRAIPLTLVGGGDPAADPLPPRARASVGARLLEMVGSLPDPVRGSLLAVALCEVMAVAARPTLPARFAFGAPQPGCGADDVGEDGLRLLLAMAELAHGLGPAPFASARPRETTLLSGATLLDLVPALGLGAERRRALGEMLADDPAPEVAERSSTPLVVRRVGIVIPTLDGAALLGPCLASLARNAVGAPGGPEVAVVVVDNGSRDDTAAVVARHPFARLLRLESNEGFAVPCNRGATLVDGEVVVLLNNDTEVEPGWLPGLLDALRQGAGAASSLVLSADGRTVDFGGGGASFEGKGFQDGFGATRLDAYRETRPILFGNGASLAVTRAAWDEAGGFDPSFFAYYEDVDLGMRLTLLGHEVVLAPASRVRHRHNATSKRFLAAQKAFHMERNALYIVAKSYGGEALARVLPAALLLLARRAILAGRLAAGALGRADDGRAGSWQDGVGSNVAWDELARHLAAVTDFLASLPELAGRRRTLQKGRRVDDRQLVARMGHFLDAAPTSDPAGYGALQGRVLRALGVTALLSAGVRRRVLIVTHEDLGSCIAGPAIRVVELARVLARDHEVTVAAPRVEGPIEGVAVALYDRWEESTLVAIAREYDVLVVQGHVLARYGRLKKLPAAIVADLYCPFPLENLELSRGADVEAAMGAFEGDLGALEAQLVRADYFLVASEKQKDLWLGALLAAGRINPFTYAEDPCLENLVGVVPFGIPALPPRRSGGGGVKGVIAGIEPSDRLLLWGGSLVDWQDPLTVIRAMARIAARRSDVKLFFMGVAHPTPGVKPMAVVARARALAAELGLLDSQVFFHEWVPYDRRADVLLDADVAVLAHRIHVETRFSFRTRMLDCVWAELPVVMTEGDTFAELVRGRGLGATVAPGDVEGFATEVLRLLDEPDRAAAARHALRAMQDELRWERVVEPLRERLPTLGPAPDRAYQRQRGWRRMLLRWGGGELLDRARRTLPPGARRRIKRLLGMGR